MNLSSSYKKITQGSIIFKRLERPSITCSITLNLTKTTFMLQNHFRFIRNMREDICLVECTFSTTECISRSSITSLFYQGKIIELDRVWCFLQSTFFLYECKFKLNQR